MYRDQSNHPPVATMLYWALDGSLAICCWNCNWVAWTIGGWRPTTGGLVRACASTPVLDSIDQIAGCQRGFFALRSSRQIGFQQRAGLVPAQDARFHIARPGHHAQRRAAARGRAEDGREDRSDRIRNELSVGRCQRTAEHSCGCRVLQFGALQCSPSGENRRPSAACRRAAGLAFRSAPGRGGIPV